VPFLRVANADDITPVSSATIGTLIQVESELGEVYDVVVQLMANCPLRRAEHVKEALTRFEIRRPESQISCFRFGWMNPWWAVSLDNNDRPTPLHPQALTQRSQDLPTLYCPTGAIWISTPETLQRYGTFHCPAREFAEIPWQAALDIDDHEDLAMARAVAQADG
jgi:N-acylneuraminate cytidylyltransferase